MAFRLVRKEDLRFLVEYCGHQLIRFLLRNLVRGCFLQSNVLPLGVQWYLQLYWYLVTSLATRTEISTAILTLIPPAGSIWRSLYLSLAHHPDQEGAHLSAVKAAVNPLQRLDRTDDDMFPRFFAESYGSLLAEKIGGRLRAGSEQSGGWRVRMSEWPA